MKTNIFKTVIIVNILLIAVTSSFAWNGDTWGLISRETISRIAGEMIDFSWTPKNTITNNTLVKPAYYTFNPGIIYHGEPYTQNNPQQNWAEFYNSVNNTSGGTTTFGNDCSGFVSMSWKLPTRYTTSQFESDAISNGGYVTKLGETGKSNTVTLLKGDALNRSGNHVVLFDYYASGGIVTMEQTPGPRTNYTDNKNMEMRKYRDWNFLSSYRPIRRNNIDEGNYVFKTKWGVPGDRNGEFNTPWGVAVDSSGNVYVVDNGNDRIQKFDNNGTFLTKWGSEAPLVLDPWLHIAYLPICEQGRFSYANGVALDQAGNVYAVALDCFNSAFTSRFSYVQKFDRNGGFITWWNSNLDTTVWEFESGCISIAPNEYVYLLDTDRPLIRKFTSNGTFITQWGSYGSGNGQFQYPGGIAADRAGNVYVADTENNRIQKFNSGGGFISTWGNQGYSDGGQFNYPEGIAVDSTGNVYVSDSLNNRIQKFDSNGTFLTKWGSFGVPYSGHEENGKLNYPAGVAVDSSLNVFIADTYNDRIQKFAPVSPLPLSPSNLTATVVEFPRFNGHTEELG